MKAQGIENTGIIDSDKMSDVASEIFEKQNELLMLCDKYDIPFFGFSFGPRPLKSQHFYGDKCEKDERKRRFQLFLDMMNYHIIKITNGDFQVCSSKLLNNNDEISEEWNNE